MSVKEKFSIIVKTKFNDVMANSILDSGAGVSVMDLGTYEKLKLPKKINPSNDSLRDASGNMMEILGVADVDVHVIGSNRTFSHEFKILNSYSNQNVIMGRDLMKKFRTVTFDFENDIIDLDGRIIKGLSLPDRKVLVRTLEDVIVQPRTEQIALVSVKRDFGGVTGNFRPKKVPGHQNSYISKTLVSPNVEGHFCVSIVNTGTEPIHITKRQIVGHLENPDEIIAHVDLNRVDRTNQDTIKEIKESVKKSSNLTQSQQEKLTDLLMEYKDIFASDPKNPSRTDVVEHEIETGTNRPVYIKPRRIPLAWESEVNHQVEEMLSNHIIRPSKSPWNAPILLVKKKDNSTRFVCDFRGLNNTTKKDTYPLPQIKDMIDKMHGMRYWSALDAASAYWSIPLQECDKEKTAFSVPRGKYEFEVMTYGLCNAGPSYQRMIDMVLSGLAPNRVLAYIDDVAVFSETWEEHLELLKATFQALKASGISLKLSKCVFAAKQIEFLGFVLSEKGVKPQQRLTEAIEKFAKPTNKKEIRRFLGMANFYREFIPNFSEVAASLNNLTKDAVIFHWSKDCETAFKTLKQALVTAPILAFPKSNEEFVVEVDASKQAVGGVLSQNQDDGILHPVAYFSTTMNDAQRNWSPYIQEAYAIVMAVRHWDTYLAGKHFTVLSDHNPLVQLKNKKNPKGKIARWLAELEGYDFTVKYVPGKSNVKADMLSRNSNADDNYVPDDSIDEMIFAISTDTNMRTQLSIEQKKDVITATTMECIEKGEELPKGRLKRVARQLRIEKGVLTKNGRPVVPPSMRGHIVAEIHKLGHFGLDKLQNLVRRRFYWPGMYRYLKNFVNQCNVCAQCKVDNPTPKAPLIPIREPQSPLEFISMDIAHFPTTKDGFKGILLIGDIFSKFVEAVPLKLFEADEVVDALWRGWITKFSCPEFVHSDQGSNVDGDTVQKLCEKFNIAKRRTSGYHSEGNGFAERNIRSIREILRTLLLDFEIAQNRWDTILPSVIFALNTSVSASTKFSPYEIIFGRRPVLPIDLIMGTVEDFNCASSPDEYVKDLRIQLKDVITKVNENLEVSRQRMMAHYNQKIVFHDYRPDDKAWLKKKCFKPGESRKLAPRKTGPWTIIRKLPNGVNFEIQNDRTKVKKIVHHNRLSPVTSCVDKRQGIAKTDRRKNLEENDLEGYSTDSSSSGSDNVEENENSEQRDDSANEDGPPINQRYPQRTRTARIIEGAIPWDSVPQI